MRIDLPTIIFLMCILSFVQALAMYIQYRIVKHYEGPGWWTLASIVGGLGFIFNYLRVIPELNAISIVGNTILYYLGYIFLYIGLKKFFNDKEKLTLILIITIISLLISNFFTFAQYNTVIRKINISLYIVVISFYILKVLNSNSRSNIRKSVLFLITIFAINGCFFLFRSLQNLGELQFDDSLVSTPMQEFTYLIALINTSLWTFGMIIMINQRLNIEHKEINENLIKIFNTSPDAVLITRIEDGKFIAINDGFTKLTGYLREEVVGKTVFEINIWANTKDRQEIVSELKTKGTVNNYETIFRIKSGKTVIGLVSANIIQIEGKPHIISVSRDITKRKQDELELLSAKERAEENENKFKAIANYAASWEAWFDTTGKLIWMNSFSETITGYKPEDYLATNDFIKMVIAEEDIPKATEKFDSALKGSSGDNFEVRILRKDGSKFWVSISWRPILDSNGNSIGFRTSTQEITERKKAENEIKVKNEQLMLLNSEKDKFFSILAHDLKSPFVGFLGLTSMLAEKTENYSQEEFVSIGKEMHDTANNLYKLLKNLLDWAQMQNGTMTYQPKERYLSILVKDSIETLKKRSQLKEIKISNFIEEDFPVFADEKMTASILLNLLSNALKFTNRNGTIAINAFKKGDGIIEISIMDNGIGMDDITLSKLFKIGERISKKGTEGELSTGLGLLLCKEFVEKQGGRIWAESKLGEGSTFYFTLMEKEKV